MWKQCKAWCVVCLLLGCAADTDANLAIQDAPLPRLFAQRVTATVKREAATLVRIETEREDFLTTPEHPFATPRSGWIPAGKLDSGDRVVSARFGTVRVVSSQRETPSHPVAVFNLTVDPSHAYLVGTDQVLVHNVRCKGQATLDKLREKNEELREAQRTLEELQKETETSPQRQADNQQQIEAVKSSMTAIRRSIQNARARLRKLGIDLDAPPPPTEGASTRAIELEIAKLQSDLTSAQDKAPIRKRIKTLWKQRTALQKRLGSYLTKHEQLLQQAEAHYESVKREHELTQSALRGLDAEVPGSIAETEAVPKRKAELQKALKELDLDLASADRIRAWEREVADFERSKSEGERPGLEQHISELKAKLAKEKQNTRIRNFHRKKRADPEQGEERRQAERARFRRKSYLADSQRPRDPIELMEDELVTVREQPASASRDQRVIYLTEAVRTLKGLAEIRRETKNGSHLLGKTRARREDLLAEAKDTTKIDDKIARLTKEQEARKAARTRLRAYALLLGLKETRRREGPQAIDEARFHAFEQAFGTPASIDEQRLDDFEREFAEMLHDESDTLDADFFEAIWREAEAAYVASQESGHGADGDMNPRPARDRSPPRSPSPEPAVAAGSGFQALQNELRSARSAFGMEVEDLIHQHAAQSQALPGPGSSRHAEGVQRLKALEAAHLQLQQRWRQQIRNRLELARQELQTRQSIESFREPTIEADLARQIALLEHEDQHPSF